MIVKRFQLNKDDRLVITYPQGQTQLGSCDEDSELVDNRDIANGVMEKIRKGDDAALPSLRNEYGNELWVLNILGATVGDEI